MDLNEYSIDSLYEVIDAHPWFGVARSVLARKMCRLGGWSDGEYANAALYVPSRSKFDRMLSSNGETSLPSQELPSPIPSSAKKAVVVGGDYFTQEQYDLIKEEGYGRFGLASGINAVAVETAADDAVPEAAETDSVRASAVENDFCTETLAEIYAEQGYYDRARDIYSKLLLAYPEKNTYFAALIEKLDIVNQK
ncbi:MAG: hypothetical protein ACI395_03310 [Candidatus Cryptobacteroides sp.]